LWNDLEHPLIAEEERRNQLAAKLENRFYFRERTPRDLLRFERDLDTHIRFERELEKGLRLDGYTPATIERTREQIRDFLLYTNRSPVRPVRRTLIHAYINQMRTSFQDSDPYRRLLSARDNHRLNLYRPGELFYQLYDN